MQSSGTREVFISHATEDKPLAEALGELIELGLGLSHDQIFCSSLAGQGIPPGTDFKGHIKGELASSAVVIALLTPNYYASAFCLCELGATWVLSKEFLPFVTPQSGIGDLKAVLKGVQALRIDQGIELDEMKDKLTPLARTPTPSGRWTAKKDSFLEKLPSILASLPKPQIPTASELQTAIEERDGYKTEYRVLEAEHATLKLKYEDLAKLKDKAAVAEIDETFSEEWERFEARVKKVKAILQPLSSGVNEALFQDVRGADWIPDEKWAGALDDDIERGLLRGSSEGDVGINRSHPKIRPATEALSELRLYLEKVSLKFTEEYEAKYTDELSITNRSFWDKHL